MSDKGIKTISGKDYYGESRSLGISRIDFKIPTENPAGVFVLENVFKKKGGPAKHLHYDQEEWFYCIEGKFLFEIGNDKYDLVPGDSLIAPRKVSHVWAHVGDGIGRILVLFSPAGMMESFFREVTRNNAMPPQDPQLWRSHGMELLGPPMDIS